VVEVAVLRCRTGLPLFKEAGRVHTDPPECSGAEVRNRPDGRQVLPWSGWRCRVKVWPEFGNAADLWGDIMKFIIEVEFPLEPFNTYVRQGTVGDKIGEVLGAIKPEVNAASLSRAAGGQ